MKIQVLDHGYVELVECWGTGKFIPTFDNNPELEIYPTEDFEIGIIEAARQSTQGSFRGWNQGDSKLLNHLYSNSHMTPFEFSGMVIEVQAPIFVFREWHRHRTQSYNEMSARYAPLPDLYYLPTKEVLMDRADIAAETKNKQAGGDTFVEKSIRDMQIAQWHWELEEEYSRCEALYQKGLRSGVPKELARLIMPVGHYSRMRASANLRNWLSFMTLRCDSQAQCEIREFADAVAQLVATKFPQTYQLWKSEQ